jgi:hypothetical protein
VRVDADRRFELETFQADLVFGTVFGRHFSLRGVAPFDLVGNVGFGRGW